MNKALFWMMWLPVGIIFLAIYFVLVPFDIMMDLVTLIAKHIKHRFLKVTKYHGDI